MSFLVTKIQNVHTAVTHLRCSLSYNPRYSWITTVIRNTFTNNEKINYSKNAIFPSFSWVICSQNIMYELLCYHPQRWQPEEFLCFDKRFSCFLQRKRTEENVRARGELDGQPWPPPRRIWRLTRPPSHGVPRQPTSGREAGAARSVKDQPARTGAASPPRPPDRPSPPPRAGNRRRRRSLSRVMGPATSQPIKTQDEMIRKRLGRPAPARIINKFI